MNKNIAIQNNPLSALYNEYGRAINDLVKVLYATNQDLFTCIKDSNTKDEDCRSIQTICNHMISSGYAYINYIYKMAEIDHQLTTTAAANDVPQVINQLENMMQDTEKCLAEISVYPEGEIQSWNIKTSWNITYNLEQMLEHGIVHIQRHRYQIENFKAIE